MNENQLIEMLGKIMSEQIAVLDRKLDEKLRPIHSEISEIKSDIKVMKRDITTMQGDIQVMKSDITTMQDDITTLQNNFITMQGDVTFIKVHVVSLDKHMDQMISKFIPELKNGVFEIRQENRALAHMFGEHSLEIEKLKS